jgi:hypothetical protein
MTLNLAAKQWRTDRKLFNQSMKKETFDIFLHHSNSEGKQLANVLGKRVTDETDDDADAPFVPDKFIKLCFLRILVESRKE